MATRMLSWKQAWKKLETAWSKATKYNDGIYRAEIPGVAEPSRGLCYIIWDMEDVSMITSETRAIMCNEIQKIRPDKCYKWSFGASGRRSRIAFCRKMAETKRPRITKETEDA